MAPTASIVIPTRGRPCYLKVALASIAPQAAAAGAEVLVIDDAGPTPEARALAASFDARYEPHPQPLGLNVARNTGVERRGDEQEWQERHRRAGGAYVRYVAAASVDHRRAGPDARLRSLARGAHARGRGARRFDAHRGSPPSLGGELLTLLGCVGHVA